MEAQWRRFAMLTPCFVSTFFTLPRYFKCSARDQEQDRFIEPHLLSFIDILMVDEAGQTPAENGGASFALAKKASVVGDIYLVEV